MKMRDLSILCFSFLCAGASVSAQGTFQNPGFESASLVPISANTVQFAPAFAGWTGIIGGVQETIAIYNDIYLDHSGISIIDQGWQDPYGGLGGLIEGNFTALLQAGWSSSTPFDPPPVDTTLSQTAVIPVGTESLVFKARLFNPSDSFAVDVGGQTLSLIPLASGANYTLYGADIHVWAGQTAEVAFTAIAERPHRNNNYLFLDSITFSNLAVPDRASLAYWR